MILRVRSNLGTWKLEVDEHNGAGIRTASTITTQDIIHQNHELFGSYKFVKDLSLDPSGSHPVDRTLTLKEQGIEHGSMLYCRLEERHGIEHDSGSAKRAAVSSVNPHGRTEGRQSKPKRNSDEAQVSVAMQYKEEFASASMLRKTNDVVDLMDSGDDEADGDEAEAIDPQGVARQNQKKFPQEQHQDSSAGGAPPAKKKRITTPALKSLAIPKESLSATTTVPSSSSSYNKFSIASYNVWFGPPDEAAGQVYPRERMAAIVDCLQAAAVTQNDWPMLFVGLQELTPSLVDYIGPPFRTLGYKLCLQPLGNGGVSYGVGMAVPNHFAILESRFVPYGNSIQGRGLMYIRTRALLLATTHLESYCGPQYTGASERETQIIEATKFCQEQLDMNESTLELAIIAGDLNWDDERKQKRGDRPQNQNLLSLLDPRWKDAGKPFDYTYDSKENPMLNGNLRRRFDRCLYCSAKREMGSKRQEYGSTSFQKVGDEVIPTLQWDKKNPYNGSVKKMPVAASDHFGIVVSFTKKS